MTSLTPKTIYNMAAIDFDFLHSDLLLSEWPIHWKSSESPTSMQQ